MVKEKKVEAKVADAKEEKEEKKEVSEKVERKSDIKASKKSVKKEKTESVEKKVKREKKYGKKYTEAAKLVDKNKDYKITEALDLLAKTSTTKFDAACEIHVQLGVKPEHAEQNIRMAVDLPSGTGKKVRVAAVVGQAKEKDAKDGGADVIGGEELVEKINKGFLDFDIVVATPDMMPKLAKVGKILGTKGLMPNPKTETVTDDPKKTIEKLKKGRVEIRNDKFGIIHAAFGKVSMGTPDLEKNYTAVMDAIKKAKPQGVKGTYLKKVSVATTMGPGIRIEME
jgi:large subunit ribosomal protein L1